MGKQNKPTTIGYKYFLSYQGDATHNEDRVKGVGIYVAIKLYKYGNLLPISLEPMYNGHFLNEIFDISINKFQQYNIEKNKFMERIFKDTFKFGEAEYEVIGHSIEVLKDICEMDHKIFHGPVALPRVETVKVSEEELRAFISDNIEGFLSKENKRAKVEKATLISLEVCS